MYSVAKSPVSPRSPRNSHEQGNKKSFLGSLGKAFLRKTLQVNRKVSNLRQLSRAPSLFAELMKDGVYHIKMTLNPKTLNPKP